MSVDQTIANLTAGHQPVRVAYFSRVLCQTALLVVASFAAVVAYYGLRVDIYERLADARFVFELAGHALLILLAMVMTCMLAYPDRQSRKIQRLGGLAGIGLFVGLVFLQADSASLSFDAKHYIAHGMACFACVVSFAVVPVIFMIWRIRKLAPVKLSEVAIWLVVMCTSIGALGVRIVIAEDAHLAHLLWHVLPVVLGVAAMLVLGRKLFRW